MGLETKPLSSSTNIQYNGFQLDIGNAHTIRVPRSFFSTKVWGRTNCQEREGILECDTGDCGPNQKCSYYGRSPITVAQFNTNFLNGLPLQYYQVSLINGFNLPISIVPENDDCKSSSCELEREQLKEVCSNQLQFFNTTGNINGCLSPCDKFKTRKTCCPTLSLNECDFDISNNEYENIFEDYCPTANTFLKNSTDINSCHTNGYHVKFC